MGVLLFCNIGMRVPSGRTEALLLPMVYRLFATCFDVHGKSLFFGYDADDIYPTLRLCIATWAKYRNFYIPKGCIVAQVTIALALCEYNDDKSCYAKHII